MCVEEFPPDMSGAGDIVGADAEMLAAPFLSLLWPLAEALVATAAEVEVEDALEMMGVGMESKSSSSQPKEEVAAGFVLLTLVAVLKLVVLEGKDELEECRLAEEAESAAGAVSSVAELDDVTALCKTPRYCSAALVLYFASPLLDSSTPCERKKALALAFPPVVILAICSSVHSSNNVDRTKLICTPRPR